MLPDGFTMMNELLDRLSDIWIRKPLVKPLSAIKAAGRDGLDRKVNFLVFEQHATMPAFLLKIVRDREYQNLLGEEYEKLQYLYAHKALQGMIPQPLGLFRYEETLVMVETCLPGISLENLLCRGKRHSPAEIIADLGNLQDWLVTFHHATAEGASTFHGQVEISERLDSLGASLSATLIHGLNALAREAGGTRIPLTARHGDFWAGNVLISSGGLGVIDWETLNRLSSPFDDLFFFMVMYSLRFQKGVFRKKSPSSAYFARAFLQDNTLSRALVRMAHAVTHSLGIDTKLVSLFFVLFLLDAASAKNHLRHTGEGNVMWVDFLKQIPSLDKLVFSQ
jgi:hypothetical protein